MDQVAQAHTRTGWIHSIRDLGKVIFVDLWNGCKYLQCVFHGDLLKHREDITMMAAVELTGEITTNAKSLTEGIELKVHTFKLVGKGSDEFRSELNSESDTHALLTKRHMMHWSPAQDHMKKRQDTRPPDTAHECTLLKSTLEYRIARQFHDMDFVKVSPPSIVDIQTEGGSTLFKVDYYGKPAYLSQSGQLYLESVVYGYGRVWCLESSFRAETSSTPRHLAEYKHLEAELAFIDFEDLLLHIEELVEALVCPLLEEPAKSAWRPPFARLTHAQAVDKLKALGHKRLDGEDYTYDDDLPDSAEMRLLEEYKAPVFLTHFPARIKAFYMKRCQDDPSLTESVDLLLPGVGETVGGSMRMEDYDELLQAFKNNHIDPEPYHWYLDTRKYGSCPHGGYGLGLERLIKAIRYAQGKPIDHVREATLYPRYFH